MKTLNEQIQRVRDVLVTCYNAIKRKGGTIPEAGLRNMSNLPDAVRSIPQSHTELVELNINTNGEYLPADYDADGFSKVTAEFDTSSSPKVKVAAFSVTNDCINDDGVWEGEDLIDTTHCVSFARTFIDCTNLKHIDAKNLNGNNIKNISQMFQNCSQLKYLNLSNLDTKEVTDCASLCLNCSELVSIDGLDLSNVTYSRYAFMNCFKLETLDLTNWDASKDKDRRQLFQGCYSLKSIVGNRTYDDVVANNITCMNGYINNHDPFFYATNLDHASLRALINGLADLTGQTAQTLTLGATLMAKLTEEDIAVAVNKNWTLS